MDGGGGGGRMMMKRKKRNTGSPDFRGAEVQSWNPRYHTAIISMGGGGACINCEILHDMVAPLASDSLPSPPFGSPGLGGSIIHIFSFRCNFLVLHPTLLRLSLLSSPPLLSFSPPSPPPFIPFVSLSPPFKSGLLRQGILASFHPPPPPHLLLDPLV